ncbi:Phosphorylase superfamily [Aspergillus sclerotialis]|uniref:Phosphorylase superfamily n=1 Tax=Aspergillus sclerotialis TaxID=2070753 RepID=A0A3A2ZIG9_9EURO|nr:Phosphorylase superfamily [Aspergillus sclerotialis]
MSFGFSIGDFITVIEHANKIRKEFVEAPCQFKAISDEVRNFSFIIQDVEVDLSGKELDIQQRTKLLQITNSCRSVLEEIEMTLKNYWELKTDYGVGSHRVKRAWKRLKWEPDDIRELRNRLNSNTTLLNAFNGRIARNDVAKVLRHQVDQEHQEILDWLSSTTYAEQQSDYESRRQPETGQWLLESPEFRAWIETPKQTLFCPGIPGAGKTILTSIVVEDLCTRYGTNSDVAIAYLYFNFKRCEEQNLEKLLATLLRQLTQGHPSFSDSVKHLYNRHRISGTRPSVREIISALHSVSSNFSRLFIVIDALDECQASDGSRNRFLDEVFSLQAKLNLNILATSRFIPEILSRFEGNPTREIYASRQDVTRYLQANVARLPSFVSRNPELQEDIITEITKAVDGMFLLAQLYLDSLMGKRSPKAIRFTLAKFSRGLKTYDSPYDAAYNEAMERIQGQLPDQKVVAEEVLLWITCAKRQLNTTELRNALAVEVGESKFDEENLPDLADMVSLCAGLVTIDEHSDVVRLVHHTTQTYFERTWTHWFPNAHSLIANKCVTYLSFDSFDAGSCSNDAEFEARLYQYPLYSYAAQSWGYHCRAQAMDEELVMQFLNDMPKLDACAQAILAEKRFGHVQYSQQVPKQVTGFHLAAYFGLEHEMCLLLGHSNQAETRDTYGRTPLSWAARDGHLAIVQLLLKYGGDPDSRDRNGQTPLSLAASKGHREVALLLLENGVDQDSKDQEGRTPLSWAASNGHEAIVQILVERDADSDSTNIYGQTPLLWASLYGMEGVVRLLLEYGVDPNSKEKNGRTPLSWAAANGDETVVRLLLEKGADPTSEDKYSKTPISWAAEASSEAVQRLLATY